MPIIATSLEVAVHIPSMPYPDELYDEFAVRDPSEYAVCPYPPSPTAFDADERLSIGDGSGILASGKLS